MKSMDEPKSGAPGAGAGAGDAAPARRRVRQPKKNDADAAKPAGSAKPKIVSPAAEAAGDLYPGIPLGDGFDELMRGVPESSELADNAGAGSAVTPLDALSFAPVSGAEPAATVAETAGVIGELVTAVAELVVNPAGDRGFSELVAALVRHPEVKTLLHMGGGYNILAVLKCGSVTELSDFVSGVVAAQPQVNAVNTHVVLKTLAGGL